jgi:hypothetical protein
MNKGEKRQQRMKLFVTLSSTHHQGLATPTGQVLANLSDILSFVVYVWD